MKKILITGGCGYIGSALVDSLQNEYDIISVDLELFGNPNIQNNNCDTFRDIYINPKDVAAVIHLASFSSVNLCKLGKQKALKCNVTDALEFAKNCAGAKFIYASSACVYGHGYNCTEETPPVLTDDLSITKYTLDSYMQVYNEVEFYGLRFGSINGWSPNLRTDLMINSMDLSAKENKEVRVFNGDAWRPILGMNDLVSAVKTILQTKEDKRGIYNVHSFNMKIKDVACDVGSYHGVPVTEVNGNKTFDFTMSSFKFERAFRWMPKETMKSILDGLKVSPILKGDRFNYYGK